MDVYGAIASMTEVPDVATFCYAEGGLDRTQQDIYQLKVKEVEKLKSRGKALQDHIRNKLVESKARLFTGEFC